MILVIEISVGRGAQAAGHLPPGAGRRRMACARHMHAYGGETWFGRRAARRPMFGWEPAARITPIQEVTLVPWALGIAIWRRPGAFVADKRRCPLKVHVPAPGCTLDPFLVPR